MNEDQEIQDQTLRAVAFILNKIRPGWDQPGTVVKLAEAVAKGHDLSALTIAAVRAANDPANRTPAVIPLDGAHWREPAPRELARHVTKYVHDNVKPSPPTTEFREALPVLREKAEADKALMLRGRYGTEPVEAPAVEEAA